MATAHGDRKTRRQGRRGRTTQREVGDVLRAARLQACMTLFDVHQRTSIPLPLLETIEDGYLSRFPDQQMLSQAVRRFADLVGLEAGPLIDMATARWLHGPGAPSAMVSVGTRTGPGAGGSAPVLAIPPPVAGTSGAAGIDPVVRADPPTAVVDLSAIRSLANAPATGVVPMVTGAVPAENPVPTENPAGSAFTTTAQIPAVQPQRRRPKPPLALRLAVWAAALLLAGSAGVLGLHRRLPAWIHRTERALQSGRSRSSSPTVSNPRTKSAMPSPVSVTPVDAADGTVSVSAATFTVVIGALAPAWVQVTAPGATQAELAGILQAGQTKTFDVSGGPLTVVFGGAHVLVAMQIGGRTVPNWFYVPPAAPYTTTFRTVTKLSASGTGG